MESKHRVTWALRPVPTLLFGALLVGCDGSLTLPRLGEERVYRHIPDACAPASGGGVLCHIDLILDESGGATVWGDDIPHCGRYAFGDRTLTVRIGEETVWEFSADPGRTRLTHLEHGTEWEQIASDRRSSCRLDQRAGH